MTESQRSHGSRNFAEPSGRADIEAAINDAQYELDGIDMVPFNERAAAVYSSAVAEYVRALAVEAERCARRQRNENISTADVDQAARYLFAGYGRSRLQPVGTIGTLLLGAALGNGLAIMTTGNPTGWGLAATVIMLVIGAVLTTFHVARDTLR